MGGHNKVGDLAEVTLTLVSHLMWTQSMVMTRQGNKHTKVWPGVTLAWPWCWPRTLCRLWPG